MRSILREVLTAHELQDLGLSNASLNADFLNTQSGFTLERFLYIRFWLVLKGLFSLASVIVLQVICSLPDSTFLEPEERNLWQLKASAEGLVEFSPASAENLRVICAVTWVGLASLAITSLDILTSCTVSRNLSSRDWWKVEAYWTTFINHAHNLMHVMILNVLWKEERRICFTVVISLIMLYSWIPRTVLLLPLLMASFDPNSKVHSTRTGFREVALGLFGQVKALRTQIADITAGWTALTNLGEASKVGLFVDIQSQTVFVVSSTGLSFICWEWLLWSKIKGKMIVHRLRSVKTSTFWGARTFLIAPARSVVRRLRQKIVTHFIAKVTGRRRNCRHEDFVLLTNSRIASPSMSGNGGDLFLVENSKGEQTKAEQLESPYAVVWKRHFNYDKYLTREFSPANSYPESNVEMKNLNAEKPGDHERQVDPSFEPLRRSCGIVPGRGSSEIQRAVLSPQSPDPSRISFTTRPSRHQESHLFNEDMQSTSTTRSQPAGVWQVIHPPNAADRPTVELAYDLLQSCKTTMVVPDSKILHLVGCASILDLHGVAYLLRKEFLAPDLLEDVEFTNSILIFLEFHVVALAMNLTEFHCIMSPIASHGFPWGVLIALAISVIRCVNSIFHHAFERDMIDGILEDE